MLINFDARLKEELMKALEGTDSCVFRAQVQLINPETGYSAEVYLRHMVIIQDFTESYMDTIQVTTEITPAQYKEIQSNMQNLECGIVLYPVNVTTGVDDESSEQINIQGVVFLQQQVDIDKQVNSSVIMGDPESGTPYTPQQAGQYFNFSFNVLTKSMHTLRQVKVNGIFSNTKIEDILHWSAQQFNIEQSSIVAPDTKFAHGSIIIPPMKDFSNLYMYLQERYGVYSKGLSYYFVNDHLYIYPSFETDINRSIDPQSTVHFINGVASDLVGVGHYHAKSENDVHIALVAKVSVQPADPASTENSGNTIALNNADTAMDRNMTVDEKGGLKKNDDTMTFLSRQNNAGNISSSVQNIRYTGNNSNLYNATAALAKDDGSILTGVWSNAVPWLLRPGQHVEYHYVDSNQEYQSSPGILQGLYFQSQPVPISGLSRPGFTFMSSIQAFIQAERKDEDAVQYTQR